MKKKAIIISIKGYQLSTNEKKLLAKEKPWGLRLFIRNIKSFVLGGHGDTMVAMLNQTKVNGEMIKNLVKSGKLTQEDLNEIVERTKKGGAEIVKYLEKGSAFYAPAAAGVEMAECYIKDLKKELPCAAYLNGEYGVKEIYASGELN